MVALHHDLFVDCEHWLGTCTKDTKADLEGEEMKDMVLTACASIVIIQVLNSPITYGCSQCTYTVNEAQSAKRSVRFMHSI